MSAAPCRLLERSTCPHCWATFPPEEVLWIAAHDDLRGDPRLDRPGQADHHLRFLPTRFTLEGHALDARGFVCQSLACPHCHLPLPRALLETEPAFVSILGAPACGKSFYLAALVWQLRQLLPRQFALDFGDTDPAVNLKLSEYENSLFLNDHAEESIPLADLIRKTEEQGDLYDTVNYGNQTVMYPRPFLFTLRPREGHPAAGDTHAARVLCLYDNAGEHFLPGKDSTASPVTRHLAQAFVLLFLFDPLQDPRFGRLCRGRGVDVEGARPGRSSRQESILQEAAARVRRLLGLGPQEQHKRPLVVVVTKLDAWGGLLVNQGRGEPYREANGLFTVDCDLVEMRSKQVRALLMEGCPELVATAEGFSRDVTYVPVSALGQAPQVGKRGPEIRPADIEPVGVTVPLLYGTARWLKQLVPAVRWKTTASGVQPPPMPARRASRRG
jgi:hypothetical protein